MTRSLTFLSLVYALTAPANAQPNRPAPRVPTALISVQLTNNRLTLTAPGGPSLRDCYPFLAWRVPGEPGWQQTQPVALTVLTNTPDSLRFTARFAGLEAMISARRVDAVSWTFSGQLTNRGSMAVELARFHYLHGTVNQDNAKQKPVAFLDIGGHLTLPADTLPAPRQALEKLWQTMDVSWPRLPDPIHDAPNWATSVDVGILIPAYDRPGWFMGFTGPGTAFGEVGFRTGISPSTFYAGTLLDNVRLEPGQSRLLETFRVSYGDWQDNLRRWADACARSANVPKPAPSPLVGYCSWYQFGPGISTAIINRAIAEIGTLPVPPGGRVLQLDDGFERMPADWRPNERFGAAWATLPARIAKTGSIPGLWVAPTTVHGTHPFLREHPDWLQRLPTGERAISFMNWSGYNHAKTPDEQKTYYLDPDHPDVQTFVSQIFTNLKQQGWRYLKIDFTYPVSTARVAYDRHKTSFETQRDLYARIRQVSGPDLLLNACIGDLGRYALGSVQIARIGGDIGTHWPTVRGNLRALLMGIPTNGLWWQADPDVFYLRRERNALTDDENYLLTGSIGLMGGLLLTSDFPSQWSASARKKLGPFWNTDGPRVPARHRILYSPAGDPLAYLVTYNDGKQPRHRLGIYNWTDASTDVTVSLSAVGLKPGRGWRVVPLAGNEPGSLQNGVLQSQRQPAHSLRIFDLMAN